MEWSQNGEAGLDTYCPYGWLNGSSPFVTVDSPGFDASFDTNLLWQTDQDSFGDTIMYQPPLVTGQAVSWVPLEVFDWSSGGTWGIVPWYDDSTYGVVPNAADSDFVATNLFPVWAQNDAVSNGSWVAE